MTETETDPPKRTPTKGDLIALVNLAAHIAGSARGIYDNDRNPHRADELRRFLMRAENLFRDAAGHFPPPRKSPWGNLPPDKREG